MKFALIWSYDPAEAGPTEGEVKDWLAFEEAAKDAGVHVYEVGFQPGERARTISKRSGELATEAGPVVGANGEVIAGFWVVDVADADAAAEWAERLPTASYGKVEVRPVVEFES